VTETQEQIVEMNNGCICCTVRGDLARILTDLREGEKKELDFERVIIETTGMANPGPVAQTFSWKRTSPRITCLNAVVTVVDAKHGHRTPMTSPRPRTRLVFADRILLSKTDLVDSNEVDSLKSRLVRMNPRARSSRCTWADSDRRGAGPAWLQPERDSRYRSGVPGVGAPGCGAQRSASAKDTITNHDHDHDHDHDHGEGNAASSSR